MFLVDTPYREVPEIRSRIVLPYAPLSQDAVNLYDMLNESQQNRLGSTITNHGISLVNS